MSIGTPTIILIIMTLLALFALYCLYLSSEERTSRGGFLYVYGAFLPYILGILAAVFVIMNLM